MVTVLSEITNVNPHAVVHVVLELKELPPTEFFDTAIRSAGNPDLFLNRYYETLHGEGEIVNINFHMILPDPASRIARRKISRKYESFCSLIWETREFRRDQLAVADLPMLISWPMDEKEHVFQRCLTKLQRLHSGRPEEVLFRQSAHAARWKSLNGIRNQEWEFAEKILIT
jgi:hypothetical protein